MSEKALLRYIWLLRWQGSSDKIDINWEIYLNNHPDSEGLLNFLIEEYTEHYRDPGLRKTCRKRKLYKKYIRMHIDICLRLIGKRKYQEALEQGKFLESKFLHNKLAQITASRAYVRSWEKQNVRHALDILTAYRSSHQAAYDIDSEIIILNILLGKHEEAIKLIESIDISDLERPRSLELLSWKAMKEGNIEKAKSIATIFSGKYRGRAFSADVNINRIDHNDISIKSNEVVLFTRMKNDIRSLPWFMGYYRSIGVDKFVIVDNESNDGTRDFLLEQNDTIVYLSNNRIGENFAEARWINELMSVYSQVEWRIFADTDEALVYPGIEQHGIDHLIKYMNDNRYEAFSAFMLDMYPKKLQDIVDNNNHDISILSDYFDNNYERYDTYRCAYKVPRGGIKSRLYKDPVLTAKVPVTRAGGGVEYTSVHTITPASVADVSGALLHYNLVARYEHTQAEKGKSLSAQPRHYDNISKIHSGFNGDSELTCDASVKYKSSMQLFDIGLLSASDKFLDTL